MTSAQGESELARSFERLAHHLARLASHGQRLRRAFFQPRVYISYQRGNGIDEKLAFELCHALRRDAEVVLDRKTTPTDDQPADAAGVPTLQGTDFVIALLSRSAVRSPDVEDDVRRAQELAKEGGYPRLLPVRVHNYDPYPATLSATLDTEQWALWSGPADTERLLHELRRALRGGDLIPDGEAAQRRALLSTRRTGPPAGVLEPDSPFYVERPVDHHVREAHLRGGQPVVLIGPRQVGKSSLLVRLVREARQSGQRIALFDLLTLPRELLTEADGFFRYFCQWLSRELQIEDRVRSMWQPAVPPTALCTEYLDDHVLNSIDAPLSLVFDQLEILSESTFQAQVFALLRSWHNNRALHDAWGNLELVLATAIEPELFQVDVTYSPFNVGLPFRLSDFSREQIETLGRRHGLRLAEAELEALAYLLGGHPYLVNHAFYSISVEGLSLEQLMARASSLDGPFASHLQRLRILLERRPDHRRAFLALTRGERIPDVELTQLASSGLVRWEEGQQRPRCRLYADALGERSEKAG